MAWLRVEMAPTARPRGSICNPRRSGNLRGPRVLAETYPVSAITRPFCFTAYYPVLETRMVPEDWRLAVIGLVADKTCLFSWTWLSAWLTTSSRFAPQPHH